MRAAPVLLLMVVCQVQCLDWTLERKIECGSTEAVPVKCARYLHPLLSVTSTRSVTPTSSTTPTPSPVSVSSSTSLASSGSVTPSESASVTITPSTSQGSAPSPSTCALSSGVPVTCPTCTFPTASTGCPNACVGGAFCVDFTCQCTQPPLTCTQTVPQLGCTSTACSPSCANGGVCLPLNSTLVVCICRPGFIGPDCSSFPPLSVTACAGGCSQLVTGGTEVTLQGVGLRGGDKATYFGTTFVPTGAPTVSVFLDGRPVTITSQAADGSEIKFTAPAVTQAGFQNLTLYDSRNGQTVMVSKLLYFDVDCVAPGLVKIDNACVECPVGALCPGGTRMWPLAGYWSESETTQPGKCAIDFTCPGSLSAQNNADGTRMTSNCLTSEGYTGPYCSQCDVGWYRDNLRCRNCEANTVRSKKSDVDLPVLASVAIILILLLCVGAIFLNNKRLNQLVTLICVFQQLVYAGRNASKFISGSAGDKISDVFRSMSILLLDVEFVKPACALPSITFAEVYWGTLVVFIIAGFCLTGASVLHAFFQRRGTCCRKDTLTAKPAGFCFYFLSRFQYCLIVLAAIVYLQLNIRIFQAIDCKNIGGVWRLTVELHTECYKGDHLGPGILSWFLLFGYSILFPVALLISLTRAARSGRLGEFDRTKFAYVSTGVRIKFFWFKASSILATFVLAANGVFIHDSAALIFAGGTSFLFNFALGGFIWPYVGLLQNCVTITIGLFAWIQLVIYLKLLPNLTLHYIGLAIGLVFIILVAIVRYKEIRDFVKKGKKCTAYQCCGDFAHKPDATEEAQDKELTDEDEEEKGEGEESPVYDESPKPESPSPSSPSASPPVSSSSSSSSAASSPISASPSASSSDAVRSMPEEPTMGSSRVEKVDSNPLGISFQFSQMTLYDPTHGTGKKATKAAKSKSSGKKAKA